MTKSNRRDFIAALAAAAGAGTCLCATGGCATVTKVGRTPAIAKGAYEITDRTVTVRLDQVSELGVIGGAVKVIDRRLPQSMIIGRAGETEYVALSLLCPHRGVEVEYRPTAGDFRCASLGHSRFGKDGTRKGGPARQSLRRFDATLGPQENGRVLNIAI